MFVKRPVLLLVFMLVHAHGVVATPALQRLNHVELLAELTDGESVETLTEESEAGSTQALDRIWYESEDGCLQTGIYETGANRYTINDPYPHDELMQFIEGGVTLTPTEGDAMTVMAGDTVMLPKGWTGVWDSEGYRKLYVIYHCPE